MPQIAVIHTDEIFVGNETAGLKPGLERDPFLANAAGILDTATTCHGQQDWTILIDANGQLEMIAATAKGNDWPLDSLARERGAKMAFRVSRVQDSVRVDGRQGLRTCSFASEPCNAAMQRLLNGPVLYQRLN